MKPAAIAIVVCLVLQAAGALAQGPRVLVRNGLLEGIVDSSGIRVFKGIPYAQAPTGDLRWKEPRPARNWKGVRKADQFGPRPIQRPNHFRDMVFRSAKMSEDCLFVNVWAPGAGVGLPVLVYFHGGGLFAGDGSEVRYDGAAMARKGVVMVTVNYRLGVFGFLAHPALTAESSHYASGNYGLLDQCAALRWVHENISAFGGDPGRVTIAGQSAGSMSVSILMASPLAKSLFAGAIGESGSVLGPGTTASLAEAELHGGRFARSLGDASIDVLRAMPADQLMEAAGKPGFRFSAIVDGYFLPEPPIDIYKKGAQAKVPLLAGWNSAEMSWSSLFGQGAPNAENFGLVLRNLYGAAASEVGLLYPAATNEEVMQAGTDLATNQFLGYSTWKWLDLQATSGGAPVFRYLYRHLLPPFRDEPDPAAIGLAAHAPGAPHSAEIAYALGNIPIYNVYVWTPSDERVQEIMMGYFVNFIRHGDPNGPGLPSWSPLGPGASMTPGASVGASPGAGVLPGRRMLMLIDDSAHVAPEMDRDRFLFLDRLYNK